ERTWLARFYDALPAGARVLDLGCGNGAPILAELVARGCVATGVDFSAAQLARARTLCPHATLVETDMTEAHFERESFDGIVAYDSVWNLPRHEQPPLFARMRDWLAVGAPLLLTLGADDAPAADSRGLPAELLGKPTFYDAWPIDMSLDHLRAGGFTIVDYDCHPGPNKGHLLILARAT
ncbi:MAG TPA: class I SAM-dependent methyltransferase, partial [Polyangia bacterium]|nr:class I SAM-dependent methyltransferase [Polyangia bacterium]